MDNKELLRAMYQGGFNPKSLFTNEITSLMKRFNCDYKTAFYELAKQKGVNPQEILDFLQQK